MNIDSPQGRTALLLGDLAMKRLAAARVIVMGCGGVGGWCAEALARSGIGHLTVVDSDTVAPSNINRQIIATYPDLCQLKADAMARRIHAIAPHCRVHAVAGVCTAANMHTFDLDGHDIIVDAIDSVADKTALIVAATACRRARLVSSMGAALKTDPGRIRTAPFDKVSGDPLARAIRQRLKKTGQKPRRKFACVYSDENVPNRLEVGPADTPNGTKRVNGTLVTVTAAFGLHLAHLAIMRIVNR